MNAETAELRAARTRLVRFAWVIAATIAAGAIGYAITMGVSPWRGLYLTSETLAYLGNQQKEGSAAFVQIALVRQRSPLFAALS
jgi:hypothetical protein